GERLSIGAPYFNKVMVPLMLGVVVLLGIGPSIPWRGANRRKLVRDFRLPVALLGMSLAVTLAFGVRDAITLVAIAAVSFAAAATVDDIARSVRARKNATGESVPRAAGQVLLLGRQRMGGLVVHLGIVLIGAGMIASGLFQTAVTVSVRPGDSFELAGHVIT